MRDKIGLKIVALGCALLMVVSCVTPCVAVGEDLDNTYDSMFSGKNQVLGQDSAHDVTLSANPREADLFVSSLNETGSTYIAPEEGIYRFMIVGGAYENCPPESQPEHPELWGWLTKILIYKNRPISWTAPCWEEYPGPGNWDFELGSWTLYDTYQQAEEASRGEYIDLPLGEEEFVTFVIQDCKECCFWDNSGGIYITLEVKPKPVPVLLVHGIFDTPDMWTTMKSRLESDGFDVYLLDYAPGLGKINTMGDIKVYARRLSDEIASIKAKTGAKEVDIVAHSMGGLISRWYIEKSGGRNDVNKLIMLGTPNHGSELCYLHEAFPVLYIIYKIPPDAKPGKAIEQMTPYSPFLNRLGYYGGADYYIIAGTEPYNLLLKVSSAFIHIYPPWCADDGAVKVLSAKLNNVVPSEYPVDHFEEATDSEIYKKVKSILESPTSKESSKYLQSKIVSPQTQETPIQKAPIISEIIYPDEEKSHNITISLAKEAQFSLVWLAGNLNLTLTTPNGTLINPSVAESDENISYYEDINYTIKGYSIQNSESGTWKVNIAAINVSEEGVDYTVITLLDTNLTLSIELPKYQYDPNEQITIKANLTDNDTAVIGASITAKISKPDNTTENITLYDDGLHNDNQTNDGIYANTYTNTSVSGTYHITVSATGTVDGEEFERQAFTTVWVEQYLDLMLNASDIAFSNDAPLVGENITINATIHNIGYADANNASILFYDGDPTNGTTIGEDIVNVSVNATANASVSWIAKDGVHEIYVLISPYNEFLEENYTNNQAFKFITVAIANVTFDTGTPANPYPSIMGMHNGTITPNKTITANKLYTYPCTGTGGHTEYARIWNSLVDVNATWNGYTGDWHNISFNKSFKLVANETYNYTIRTGSYPQIHHTSALPTANGWINCTEFIDANGRRYNNWIPAIRLE